MDEKQIEQTPPPRTTKYKVIKAMTLTLVFIAVFFAIGLIGVETTSSSKFCSSCHEMKPEYYTWKASSHSEVDCVQCHIGPGAENYTKANGLVQVFKKQTQTYTAPIRMPDEIPDEACERCHNINTRTFTVSGDIIIPHDKHKAKDVECIQCHSGTAHGKIADRKMTYQADYAKWDDSVGSQAMSEMKFIKPAMDTCIECHKARKVTTECTACHTTGMYPESHKQAGFKLQTHGSQARTELKECNVCHKDMSTEPLEGYEEASTVTKYLTKDTMAGPNSKKTHYNYAKENTFCRDCHSQRPATHGKYFVKEHGALADKNKEKCLACHDLQKNNNSTISQVTCGSCHPSSHNRNKDWRKRHPVQVAPNQKLTEYCFTCHSESTCKACHQDGKEPDKNHEKEPEIVAGNDPAIDPGMDSE